MTNDIFKPTKDAFKPSGFFDEDKEEEPTAEKVVEDLEVEE